MVLKDSLSRVLRAVVQAAFAIFIGIGIGAILMYAWEDCNPWTAYAALFRGAFFDVDGLANTLSLAVPLMLTGITFAIGVRAGLFNIGAEGQVYIGAVAAVAASLFVLPRGIHLLVAIIFCMGAGALWSLLPAVLKVTRGVHEVVSTIMLNWIAKYLCFYLVAGPLVNPSRPQRTISIAQSSRFSTLFGRADFTTAIFAGVIFAMIIYVLLWHTTIGYELRAVGLNPEASRYGGISPWRSTITAFVLGGFAAGFAGGIRVISLFPSYALDGGLTSVFNLGFDGIAVALIGRNHPIGAIFAAIFFAGLITGAGAMQMEAGISVEMIRAVEGIIVIAIAIPEVLDTITSRLKIRRRVECQST